MLANLIAEGLAFTASSDISLAAEQIREAEGKLVILPLEHRITSEMSNHIVKSFSDEHYLNLNSAPVIYRAVAISEDIAHYAGKKWNVPKSMCRKSLTDKLCESAMIYPYFLQRAAMDERGYKPAIGFYWTGNDGRKRGTTWMRSARGHDFFRLYKKGEFSINMPDKIYAGQALVAVPSISRKKEYEIVIQNLPIFENNDIRQHSQWKKLSSYGDNSDAVWRGKMHKKSGYDPVFFSSYFIAVYDAAAEKIMRTHELGQDMEVRINPFPMLTVQGKKFFDYLQNNVIIGRKGLNLTEMDRLIGADTKNNGYDFNFVNWRRH
ncbi:hypothetical protein GF323_02500 [Candidatus Woesearchaeota archaeon]|nr:hypothetical protein [Candidatus Woesearchaeota archaeon]